MTTAPTAKPNVNDEDDRNMGTSSPRNSKPQPKLLKTTAGRRQHNVVLALVPYRKSRPLSFSRTSSISVSIQLTNDETTTTTTTTSRTIFPWLEIPASDTTDRTCTSTTIGRIELLQTLWTACGCHSHVHCNDRRQSHDTDDMNNDNNNKDKNNNNDNNNNNNNNNMPRSNHPYDYLTGRGCTTNKCVDCRAVTDWSKRYLPRAWIRMNVILLQQQQGQRHQQTMAVTSTNTNTKETAGVDGDDSTAAAIANDTDTASATPAFQVSLEFKASKYPVETLVRILHHHPEQQPQEQQQQQQPASEQEVPAPPVEQPGVCSITAGTTTADTTIHTTPDENAAFVSVRKVTLNVGDVISFYPPAITGVGATTSSASWAPLELQLVQFAVVEEAKDDYEDDEEHLDEQDDEDDFLKRVTPPALRAAPLKSHQHDGAKGQANDDESNSNSKAITVATTAPEAIVVEARGCRKEMNTTSSSCANTTFRASNEGSTNAVSLYASALQALQGSPMAGETSPSNPATPARARAMIASTTGTSTSTGDGLGSGVGIAIASPEYYVQTQALSPMTANESKPAWTEAADDSSDDENDRLCSQAEEYHGHTEDESSSQVVQQQSPPPPSNPPMTRDDDGLSQNENRKQDGTSTSRPAMDARGGPGLEQTANDVTKKPTALSVSTVNHNAVEQQSPAPPILPKENGTLALPTELATTPASAEHVAHETTAVQATPALASSKATTTTTVADPSRNVAHETTAVQPAPSNKAPITTTAAIAQSRNVAHETTDIQPAIASSKVLTATASATASRNVAHESTAAQATLALASSKALTTTTAIAQSRNVQTSHPLAQSPKQSVDGYAKKKLFVLYFVERGLDMEKRLLDGDHVIEGLKEHCRQRGATILESFDKNHPPWPTYLVISTQAKVKSVMKELGFDNEQILEEFLGQHNIVCAKRQWAAEGSKVHRPPFREPSMMEKYLGIWPKKRASPDAKKRPPRIVRRRTESPASLSANARGSNVVRNRQLSEVFHKLSKLHQECPLTAQDNWKSYSFNVTSGRLRYLNFEITNEPEVLKRIKEVKGIGPSQMQMIQEFLETGSLQRIQEMETDPRRVAMKRFMNIWGVGRVKALELLSSGYETIDQVKNAVESGKLILDRNQYIGLDCYDDIQEEMVRSEVEKIGAIITDTFKMRFPSAEITIMGSYRRGKPGCGDVDLLITHPDYYDVVPPRALGQVVNELLDQGHISHHLTFIAGMNHDNYDNFPESIASKLIRPKPQVLKGNEDKFSGSSYMGVFLSPVVKGRRRRVDIKFYPYRERIFASLYFTGNGYFNRSMRLWANRKFHYSLNDHGLFKKDTTERVLEATSENEVFQFLGLVWKEPHERDCFDAVIGKGTGETVAQLEDLSQSDLRQESQEHKWID